MSRSPLELKERMEENALYLAVCVQWVQSYSDCLTLVSPLLLATLVCQQPLAGHAEALVGLLPLLLFHCFSGARTSGLGTCLSFQ